MNPRNETPDSTKTANRNSPTSEEENQTNPDLRELFLDELADLTSAETQLTKALPKMADAAKCEELAEAFRSHLEETKNHVERLKQVFTALGERSKSKTCKAMQGLVEEGSELIEELKDSSAIDDGLIAAAQKVEHYEIASYGTVIAWAERLGETEAVSLLEATLAEEEAADEKLSEIAEGSDRE